MKMSQAPSWFVSSLSTILSSPEKKTSKDSKGEGERELKSEGEAD